MQTTKIAKMGLLGMGIILLIVVGLQVTQGAALDDTTEPIDDICQKHLWGETDTPQGPHGNGLGADEGNHKNMGPHYRNSAENCTSISG